MRAAGDKPTRGRRLLGVALSAIALVGCVWWALGQEAPRFPDSPELVALLGVSLLLYAVATLLRCWRWDAILSWAGVGHKRADAYGLVVVGYMGNTVLPARGGELLRILLLSERTSARRREVLGTILPERLLDAAALIVLFGAVTAAGVAGAPAGTAPALVAGGLLILAVGGLVVYLRLRIAGRLQRFADRIRPVARASRLLLTPTGLLLAAVSVVVWLLEAGVFYFVAESLELGVSLPESLLVVVLASFFALIPAAPGYVGTYDAAVLFALRALDLPGGQAVGAALLFRFVVFVPITAVGLLLMVVRYGGLGTLRRWRSGDSLEAAVSRR